MTKARVRGRPLEVDYAKVAELLKSDMTYTAIAAECGCSVASVHSFAQLKPDARRKLVARSKKNAG